MIGIEPGEGPESSFEEFIPTAWPGARLPHVWLEDGTAMQDRIGYDQGFTLLRFSGGPADCGRPVAGLCQASACGCASLT